MPVKVSFRRLPMMVARRCGRQRARLEIEPQQFAGSAPSG